MCKVLFAYFKDVPRAPAAIQSVQDAAVSTRTTPEDMGIFLVLIKSGKIWETGMKKIFLKEFKDRLCDYVTSMHRKRLHVCVFVCVCVCACVRARARGRVCVCVCVFNRTDGLPVTERDTR